MIEALVAAYVAFAVCQSPREALGYACCGIAFVFALEWLRAGERQTEGGARG
ncbi:MAG TPA: hypothetical protein VGK73_38810 [Polyangiaceae bacterium]